MIKKSSSLRLAIFGGSFDPIHYGHLISAMDCLEQIPLNKIIFMPCSRSPFKKQNPQATGHERLEMIQLAIEPFKNFEVCPFEVQSPAPSYSIKTAKQFHKLYPQAELFWIIGSDQIAGLPRWKDYAELIQIVKFIVVPRSNYPFEKTDYLIPLPKIRYVDISSTEIRERVKKDLPFFHLLPEAVFNYIKKHSIYIPNKIAHEK
ncbi:nicotinate-nucleotide adenylyltransferase [Methylacidiphilum caldifontis]|uniref:Probable nicotinate-nucleotide adenylyltransferase n=1 Tax=Methylacidiphilum caldifontis TaxID=2795386 RepID=A0A4Y8PH26_9BACT|nr:nicotinate-nucleotide adenylyltransferase [Methylacidiphilum caldifontis]QSR88768.1 nicotinate (nicotinamide) nucleotide adenylyltransferase [Methylacidiphilum caldifontis]TFE71534.1 nicotinate (nicotinamide) nucleotide adenylyltransferase [Methylacidiphilum caldifontis]